MESRTRWGPVERFFYVALVISETILTVFHLKCGKSAFPQRVGLVLSATDFTKGGEWGRGAGVLAAELVQTISSLIYLPT